MLGIWRGPARLLICRHGRPLHWGEGPDGYYFGSLPDGLPGQPTAVPDNTTRVLAFADGALARTGDTIKLEAE
jgi:hypothetical protein